MPEGRKLWGALLKTKLTSKLSKESRRKKRRRGLWDRKRGRRSEPGKG